MGLQERYTDSDVWQRSCVCISRFQNTFDGRQQLEPQTSEPRIDPTAARVMNYSSARLLLRRTLNKEAHLLQKRRISLSTLLFPPAVFGGLLVSLWTLKSISMVIFQNKIIYLPYLPPYTRDEPVPEPKDSENIEWERTPDIKGANGVKLATCRTVIGRYAKQEGAVDAASKEIVVLYLQGNAGSAPMRLPRFSRFVLSGLKDRVDKLTFVYPSYRGYWQSTGRPNPRGMRRDIPFILESIKQYLSPSTKIIVWGESIGTVIGANLAAEAHKHGVSIAGLILETPFPNLAELVREMYPQKWLPYYYLTPFLFENWPLKEALEAWWKDANGKGKILILNAARDELVGERLGKQTTEMVKELCGKNLEVLWVKGAGHQDCLGTQSSPVVQKFVETI